MTGNIIIGQSGGPTAVINSSAAGVYKAAKAAGVKKVYGMIYGIQGFMEDKILDMDEYLSDDEGIELLKDACRILGLLSLQNAAPYG